MRSLLDIHLSRYSLLLIAVVSAVATVLIVRGGGDRSPAELAALTAVRDRPRVSSIAAPTTASARTSSSRAAASASGGSSRKAHAGARGAGTGSGGGAGSGGGQGAGSNGSLPSTPAAASSPSTTPSTSSSGSGAATGSTSSGGAVRTKRKAASDLPKVGHVFEIVLSDRSYGAAFGRSSKLSYLRALVHKGTLLRGYRSLGSGELADELALVSGQAPNRDTAQNCVKYADFSVHAVAKPDGDVPGRGCVYPETALTIGDQVTASGKVWGAYVADMGHETCVHPNSDAVDDLALPDTVAGYDTRHNPFIYFHSLLDLGDCASDDVDLTHLPAALAHPAKTPAFTYLAADACADADPTTVPTSAATTTTTTTTTSTTTTSTTPVPPSTSATPTAGPAGCPARAKAGPLAENAFLKRWVPRILHSAAYRKDGVLAIVFTHGGRSTGHPVRTGALLLSRWTRPGRTLGTPLEPYSMLRFAEDALHLTPLAHAKTVTSIAKSVLSISR